MVEKYYADIEALAIWADEVMASRKPDFVINHFGKDYLRRWWVLPRNHFQNIYLHEILEPDDARALHDHPWDNTSLILRGRYDEVTPEGTFCRFAGHAINRSADSLHRLELVDDQPVISLFITGPIIREWGFACPKGWRSWKDFVQLSADGTESHIGRGCED